MTCVMEVMNDSGHLTLEWNPEEPESVARARREFDLVHERRAQEYAVGKT